jgi:hypothetical protein
MAVAGESSIIVYSPGSGWSAAAFFTINPAPPTITSVTPASVTAGGAGGTMTVTGTAFTPGATSMWNTTSPGHGLHQPNAVVGLHSGQSACELRHGQHHGQHYGRHIGSGYLHHQSGAAANQQPEHGFCHGGRTGVHAGHRRKLLYSHNGREVGLHGFGDNLCQLNGADGRGSRQSDHHRRHDHHRGQRGGGHIGRVHLHDQPVDQNHHGHAAHGNRGQRLLRADQRDRRRRPDTTGR